MPGHRSDRIKPIDTSFSVGETLSDVLIIPNQHDAMPEMIIHVDVADNALDQFEIQILIAPGVYERIVWKRGQYIRPVVGGTVLACLSDMASIPGASSSWVKIETRSFAELRIQAASSSPLGSTGTIFVSGAALA